ncbi:MAG: glycosyltransferase family 2 protein [Rhodopirellula sp.]|nr:glycosyltransferase family 2 protein [Rhodopirellula sp.]
MLASIVIASRNHAQLLHRTLASIRRQQTSFAFEVIVVDDGSTDETAVVCRRFAVDYCRLENERYRNPSLARNVGYRRARGDVIVAQSDDVMHSSPNNVQRLVRDLAPGGEFLIATVYDRKPADDAGQYTGLENRRPLFFLGSLRRRDLYAVGGNDEEFTEPGYEDDWFADCLIHGLGLAPRYHPEIVAWHQPHPRPHDLAKIVQPSRLLYARKRQAARRGEIRYCAAGGPWMWINHK